MIFKSQAPDINCPPDVALWSWLFDSRHSVLHSTPTQQVKGFTDAITKEHISFHDIKEHTTYLSTALKTFYGINEQDVVLVCSKNTIWYPVATLSAVRIGAVACGVSPEYNVEELTFSLVHSKAKVLLTAASNLKTACAAAAKAGIPEESVILLSGASPGRTSIQDLIRKARELGDTAQARPYEIPRGQRNSQICASLCFSSGTTGVPKAVMISHANIMAQCLQIQQITPSDHTKILAALPFYHITGIVHQLHLPILLNANVYVLPTFTLDSLLATVSKHKIKELLIVPPILIRLVREPKLVSKYDLSHVTRFSSGAAPLSQEILNLLEQQFPGTGFKQGYGMTESCSAITSHPPSRYAYEYAHSVGMLVPSTEARIVDPETGKDCGVGKTGEIWARGPQVTMGYLNNAKATLEVFDKEGYLHTGDIGKFDEHGMLFITDRLKEMIKVKGIGVAPAELENLLLGHPAVSDVAVCGVPDERAGERPKAYVVLKSSQSQNPTETARNLLMYVKEQKARHKRLKEVEVVEKIPKSAAGKILRRKLRSMGKTKGSIVVQDDSLKAKL